MALWGILIDQEPRMASGQGGSGQKYLPGYHNLLPNTEQLVLVWELYQGQFDLIATKKERKLYLQGLTSKQCQVDKKFQTSFAVTIICANFSKKINKLNLQFMVL